MSRSNQKGFIAQLLLFLILAAGLGIGIYLVQTRTGWFSKAAPVIPDQPETSFELEAQADTSPNYTDATPLKFVTVGQKFRVDIWVRSDIDPANLFVAKLKFPADLLKAEIIDSRENNSFIMDWVERMFDVNGNISLIGGLSAPGLLTSSSQSTAEVKGVSAMSVNTATSNGSHAITIGKEVQLQAVLTGTAKSGQVWVAKLPDGRADFTCPSGIFANSKGEKWCKIAEGKGPTLTGSFTPQEEGDYVATVNAFTNETATYTGNPADECSGNPFAAGPSNNPAWSYCGSGTDFTLITHPGASLTGPTSLKAGEKGSFKATLAGGAKSGQIWVTKGDGKSEFYCPHSSDGKPYKALNGLYWCKIVEWKGSAMEGSYGADEIGSYTAVVNAFSGTEPTGDAPTNRCTGTPESLGFDSGQWSDCGPDSRLAVTITPVPTKPLPEPDKPKLLPSRLMASIIFEAKKAGSANIEFADNSEILRNSDGLNILSAKKGLVLKISETAPVADATCDINALDAPVNSVGRFENPLAVQFVYSAVYQSNNYVTAAQWDFDGDNKWDTDMSMVNAQSVYNFPNGGVYNTKLRLQMADGGITPVCSKQITVPLKTPISSGQIPLQCNAITVDAQEGKMSSGDRYYIVESKSKTKIAAQFIPSDSKIEWVIESHSNNLPDGGRIEDTTAAVTSFTAPANKVVTLEGVTIRAELKSGDKKVECPKVTMAVKSVIPQGPVSDEPTKPEEIKKLRRDGDINGDGKINLVDMSRLLAAIGQKGAQEADLNSDESVNAMDILQLRSILAQNGVLGKK